MHLISQYFAGGGLWRMAGCWGERLLQARPLRLLMDATPVQITIKRKREGPFPSILYEGDMVR
jgi:hypothetical protein